jgi:hypothetical protein
MTRARALLILVGTLALSAAAAAQTPQKPNFAGKWALVPDPGVGSGGGSLGQTAVITQDAATLTIARTTPVGEFTSIYKLDGTESRNTLTVQGSKVEQSSRTKWNGNTLHIDTTMTVEGSPINVSTDLSLDASGNLIVVSTRPDPQMQGTPVTARMTYKKAQ